MYTYITIGYLFIELFELLTFSVKNAPILNFKFTMSLSISIMDLRYRFPLEVKTSFYLSLCNKIKDDRCLTTCDHSRLAIALQFQMTLENLTLT